MFTYTKVQSPNGEYINIKSNRAEDIVNAKISKMYNYMSPLIAITNVTQDSLELEHVNPEIGTIYYKDLPKVMGYIYEAWGNVVDLQTLDAEGKIYHFTFDEGGFSDSEPKDEKKLIRKIKRP
jgi:spore cortex formation protein SpoVR/YcgB (stage V sporulation)